MKLIIELKDETYKFYKENALILIARGNGRILASEVYGAIKNGKPYDETDRWIPVSERLPDTDGRYLVLLEKGYAEDYSLPREQIENFEVEEGSFGVWHENYNMRTLGYLDSEWSAIPVTDWRPLPRAPESEAENEQED